MHWVYIYLFTSLLIPTCIHFSFVETFKTVTYLLLCFLNRPCTLNWFLISPQGHCRWAHGSAHQDNARLAQDPGVQATAPDQQARASRTSKAAHERRPARTQHPLCGNARARDPLPRWHQIHDRAPQVFVSLSSPEGIQADYGGKNPKLFRASNRPSTCSWSSYWLLSTL